MALKAVITQDEHQQLPEALQAEYSAQASGEFRLDVTPAGGLTLENTEGLKSTLNKANKQNRALQGALGQFGDVKFGEKQELEFEATFTPEQHQKVLDDLEQTKKTLQEQDPSKRIEEARQAAAREVAKELQTKHQEELKTIQGEAQTAIKNLRTARAEAAIERALDESGARAKALLRPVLLSRTGFDDEHKPYVMDDDGQPAWANTGEKKTHLDLLGDMKKDEEFKVCWPADPAQGGGTNPGQTPPSRSGEAKFPPGVKVL